MELLSEDELYEILESVPPCSVSEIFKNVKEGDCDPEEIKRLSNSFL